MKKILLITALLALPLIAARSFLHVRLVKLTIVNKSGLPLEIRMTGEEEENYYYLHIPKGDRFLPTVENYTIVPDTYSMQPYYVELWDPVYGYHCSAPGGKTLDLYRNTRVVIGECDRTLPNSGEPTMVKFGGAAGRGRRR